MNTTFDPSKNEANVAKHGLSFDDFDGFDSAPHVVVDDRHDDGEVRYLARGRIDGVGHCLVFVIESGALRLISFRRAHEKEMRRYG